MGLHYILIRGTQPFVLGNDVYPIDAGMEQEAVKALQDSGTYSKDVEFWCIDAETMQCVKIGDNA